MLVAAVPHISARACVCVLLIDEYYHRCVMKAIVSIVQNCACVCVCVW